jgi:hypothetical protein
MDLNALTDDELFELDWANMATGDGGFTFDEILSGDDLKAMADAGTFTADSSFFGTLKDLAGTAGKAGFDALKRTFTKKDELGKDVVDWAALATAGAGLYGLANKDKAGGYNKPVPKMDVTRAQVPYAVDPNRRPGEAGRRYFSDTMYTPQGNAEALTAAQTAAANQAQGIMAAAPQYVAPPPNPYAGKIPLGFNPPDLTTFSATSTQEPIDMQNQQGTTNLAQGGIADAGRYLQGKTDGMADEIPSSIDGEQPAALSHGEFVVPADVVSHLGNGNSEAGAQKLYQMMDRIREARTGTKEQGKQINPDEFTMGGLAAAYAGGGAVKGFNGTAGSAVSNTTTAAPAGAAGQLPDTSRTSTLSPWVGDYVTNALGQGAALGNAPYQAYTGPLTAGASNLQQQAFAGASDLAGAGYTPSGTPQYSNITAGNVSSTFAQPAPYATGTFTSPYNAPDSYNAGTFTNPYNAPDSYTTGQFNVSDFGSEQAQKYINPYIQSSLDPQLKELQRQADIQRMADAGRLTQAGAFGGSRQAIMESEGRRNLLDKQATLLGTGYANAYDKALAQFNADQGRQLDAQRATEASRQFGATQGMTAAQLMAQYGMSAQQAQEASRQFGATQSANTADAMAKYGLSAQQAQEASRQFGATSGLTAATTAGQQSLEAQRANQLSGIEAARANQAAALQAAQAAEASRQFGAGFGLKTVDQLANLGGVQRGITSEGLAADKAQFEEERNFAYEMPKYQLSLLSGLPTGATTTATNQDAIMSMNQQVSGLAGLYKTLAGLGVK